MGCPVIGFSRVLGCPVVRLSSCRGFSSFGVSSYWGVLLLGCPSALVLGFLTLWGVLALGCLLVGVSHVLGCPMFWGVLLLGFSHILGLSCLPVSHFLSCPITGFSHVFGVSRCCGVSCFGVPCVWGVPLMLRVPRGASPRRLHRLHEVPPLLRPHPHQLQARRLRHFPAGGAGGRFGVVSPPPLRFYDLERGGDDWAA